MIPTLVIGLREGLEASLIVGIIASFLARNGRRDALRATWIGVITATILCVGVGIALVQLSKDLPQQAQEGLETVIGALAVIMVTSMIIWMNKHARSMKRELEGAAAQALASGSAGALVAMAFLAVLREGFETAVFLVSVLENSNNVASATAGAVIGIVIAIAIGYGIYRGGVRLNLARFFKITGVVLVIVAAGLTMTVLHTAHEAGWLNVGQATPLNLSWLVRARHRAGVVAHRRARSVGPPDRDRDDRLGAVRRPDDHSGRRLRSGPARLPPAGATTSRNSRRAGAADPTRSRT